MSIPKAKLYRQHRLFCIKPVDRYGTGLNLYYHIYFRFFIEFQSAIQLMAYTGVDLSHFPIL